MQLRPARSTAGSDTGLDGELADSGRQPALRARRGWWRESGCSSPVGTTWPSAVLDAGQGAQEWAATQPLSAAGVALFKNRRGTGVRKVHRREPGRQRPHLAESAVGVGVHLPAGGLEQGLLGNQQPVQGRHAGARVVRGSRPRWSCSRLPGPARARPPCVRDWNTPPRPTPTTISAWWRARPYNMGIASSSQLLVVDLDMGHGQAPAGAVGRSPGRRGCPARPPAAPAGLTRTTRSPTPRPAGGTCTSACPRRRADTPPAGSAGLDTRSHGGFVGSGALSVAWSVGQLCRSCMSGLQAGTSPTAPACPSYPSLRRRPGRRWAGCRWPCFPAAALSPSQWTGPAPPAGPGSCGETCGSGLQRDRSEAQAYGERRRTAGNGADHCSCIRTAAAGGVAGQSPAHDRHAIATARESSPRRSVVVASASTRARSPPSRAARGCAPYMATDPATGGIICWQHFGPNMAEGP